MKPLLFASLLVISSASVAFAQCKNGWCKVECFSDGTCDYVKVLSRNYPYVIYLTKTHDGGMFKTRGHCQQNKWKFLAVDNKPWIDEWRQVMPGSNSENILELACKM